MGIPDAEDLKVMTEEADADPGTDVLGWADSAMYSGEPHLWTESLGVMPTVTLLNMTHDPLGSIAAMTEMYQGRVVRSLADLTDIERRKAWEDATATHLTAPLEAVKFHFMIEGVDRGFTHQLVRQRTAVYAQESHRFAVIEDLRHATTLPPSLQRKKEDDPQLVIWNNVINTIQAGYEALVSTGMPQEDARGLLPTCVATRVNYITDLRNIVEHAGNRLCTQAQFHWRAVFSQIVSEIRNYGEHDLWQNWQCQMIADSDLFRPVCYRMGKCPFKAGFDRACTIRERMDSGRQDEVNPAEWMLDPTAARS